jgi:hypothetical protein
MFGCTTDGCNEPACYIGGRCNLHEAVAAARRLTPEAFDRLRETLAKTSPLTDDEKREKRLRTALSRIEWQARDLARSVLEASTAGAPGAIISEQIRRGDVAAQGLANAVNAAAAEGAERAQR